MLQLANLNYTEGLLKYLIDDELIFESVYNFTKSLILLSLLENCFLQRLNDLLLAQYFFLEMYDVSLELDNPGFSLRYVFVKLANFSFELLYYVQEVAFLKVKLPNPDFVLADFVLVLSNLVFLGADLQHELIIFLLRLIVLPTQIIYIDSLTLLAQCT